MSEPLILASRSHSRQEMLRAADVVFDAMPADVDERAIEAGMKGASGAEIAAALALAKARAAAADHPARLVLGSDSVLEVAGKRFDKPGSREEAAEHLRFFSGRVMQLTSAAALLRGERVMREIVSTARLHVIDLSDAYIADYLDAEWPEVAGCVGVFRIEARGVRLFQAIEGDYFTVLGMPLLQVLGALRETGALAS